MFGKLCVLSCFCVSVTEGAGDEYESGSMSDDPSGRVAKHVRGRNNQCSETSSFLHCSLNDKATEAPSEDDLEKETAPAIGTPKRAEAQASHVNKYRHKRRWRGEGNCYFPSFC